MRQANEAHPAAIRYALGGLLVFGALSAFASGYYGLSGAEGGPTEWLAGSPFADYFVPSLILFVFAGGSFLVAAVAVFGRLRISRLTAFGAGVVVVVGSPCRWPSSATCRGCSRRRRSPGLLVLILAWLLPK